MTWRTRLIDDGASGAGPRDLGRADARPACAHEVGGRLAVVVDGVDKVIELLDRFPTREDEDGFRVYGPYHRRDTAGTSRSGWLPTAGRRFAAARSSTLRERFDGDAAATHGDALKSGPDRDRHYTGVVSLTFKRDLDSDTKHIHIEYDDFTVTQEVPIHEYFAATSYKFLREADGSGTFHVDIASTFQTLLRSGPEVERMTIDMAWDASGVGRAHAKCASSPTRAT